MSSRILPLPDVVCPKCGTYLDYPEDPYFPDEPQDITGLEEHLEGGGVPVWCDECKLNLSIIVMVSNYQDEPVYSDLRKIKDD